MRRSRAAAAALSALLLLAAAPPPAAAQQPAGSLTALSRERLVFQTQYGDLHLAFYPNVSAAGAVLCRHSRQPTSDGSPGAPPPTPVPPPLHCAQAAPKTVDHIKRCGELGLYTTNHFFRVRGVQGVLAGGGSVLAAQGHFPRLPGPPQHPLARRPLLCRTVPQPV